MSDKETTFRDHVATMDEKGKRLWIYAKKPGGTLFRWRIFVSVILLAVFFLSPFITIDGEPLFLFDVLKRKFVILGQVFFPQDFLIFGLAMLTFFIFIVLFTIIYGRVWCGWACPQTIFMEMIFRQIEYWLEGDGPKQRNDASSPVTPRIALRKIIKNIIFVILSLIIGNYILLYLVGKERIIELFIEGPTSNFGVFSATMIFSFAVFANFSWLREQSCALICPYGRLQGALLDSNSLVVAYDYKRGEPKGSFINREDRKKAGKGDCVACNNCVAVCPTGIDIRNGTQLECVNCTACIDACNSVMKRFNLPSGLIRFASENEIETGSKFKFTARMILYTLILSGLIFLLTFLVFSRSDMEATILRVPGTLYFLQDDGRIKNIYNLRVINNKKDSFPVELKLLSHKGEINIAGNNINISPLQKYEGIFIIIIEKDQISSPTENVEIGVYSNGNLIDKKKTTFVGP